MVQNPVTCDQAFEGVQKKLRENPKYWRAKECDETPLGSVNKEKSHFSS